MPINKKGFTKKQEGGERLKAVKKLLAMIVCLLIMIVALAAPSWAATDVELVEKLGVIKGKQDGITEEYLNSVPLIPGGNTVFKADRSGE